MRAAKISIFIFFGNDGKHLQSLVSKNHGNLKIGDLIATEKGTIPTGYDKSMVVLPRDVWEGTGFYPFYPPFFFCFLLLPCPSVFSALFYFCVCRELYMYVVVTFLYFALLQWAQ